MRLRTALFLLSAATALPLAAFALLAAGLVVQHENENLVEVAKARNRATISAVDAELRGTIGTLQALAADRGLAADDVQSFHTTARSVLATQPSWNNVLLHDPSGRQLANASLPWGTPLLAKPVAPDSLEAAVRTLQPAIEDLAAAPLLANRQGIPVRVPVVRAGKAVYVVTAVVSPDAFQQLLLSQNLPAGWVSGLVDKEGRLIARVPAVPVGTRAGQSYLDNIRGADEGWFRSTVLEGSPVYTAFRRSELTGWTIGYAVPAALVSAGAERAAWLMAVGIALSLGAAALIGYWLSRRISRPMSALANAAASLGAATQPPEVRSTIHEVDQLSAALRGAARAIAVRDRELSQQAAELTRANVNKGQFLALLSHELRNPLAPLRNGLALLRMRRDPQGVAETTAMMERQVAHLTRLIDDLLDLSRIDRGQFELRRERLAVDAAVRTAIEAAKPAMEAKQQALVSRYAPEPLYVDADPVRLSQVVSNLLNNAAKFTPARGSIEIATRADGAEAVVCVTDSGVGFAPEDGARIFDMFVQLDASRRQAAGGLGIGLSIARSLVEMHGGRIAAESGGPGTGATFTVRLPLAAAPEPVAAAAPSAGRSAATSRRVLVVDDNADAADSLAQILRLEGFDVRIAYDGIQALEIARADRPEVAFIDLNMPGLSGTVLAARLLAQPWASGLRLVAVTGMGQPSDVEATRAAGFHAHLTKPALPEEILRLAAEAPDNVVALRAGRRPG